jgi:hypothetical protein
VVLWVTTRALRMLALNSFWNSVVFVFKIFLPCPEI